MCASASTRSGSVTVIVQLDVAVPPSESVAFATKENAAAEAGVPATPPVTAFRFRPPGSAPEAIEYVYVSDPPLPLSDDA